MKSVEKEAAQHELERELIAGILYRPNQFPMMRDKVRLSFIVDPLHRRIFEAIERCTDREIEITVPNVALEAGLSPSELNRFVEEMKTTGGDTRLLTYKLVEHFVDRQFVDLSGSLHADGEDPLDKLRRVEDIVQLCQEAVASQRVPDRLELLERYSERLLKNAEEGGEPRIPTGLSILDRFLNGGLAYGDLSILGGVPGAGKSSFLLGLGLSAIKAGIGTVLLEGEMTSDQILVRLNAISENAPAGMIRHGREFEKLTRPFLSKLYSLPFHVAECDERSLKELRSKIQHYASAENCRLFLVDYLQSFAECRKSETEYEAVSRVSRELRILALRFKVHILAASSLNRLHITRGEKPGLQSLRSSGQLGHDAAVAMFLIGDENDDLEIETRRREIELLIAKNREGPRGVIRLAYLLDTQRFEARVSTGASDGIGPHEASGVPF